MNDTKTKVIKNIKDKDTIDIDKEFINPEIIIKDVDEIEEVNNDDIEKIKEGSKIKVV